MVDGKAALVALEKCDYCANCEDYCPHGAISLPYEIVADAGPHAS